MALTWNRVQQEAQAVQDMSERILLLFSDMSRLLDHNSAQAIDWAAGETPPYMEEEPVEKVGGGNLSGLPYSRQEIANAIGTFAFFTSQTAHLGNLFLMARP